MKTADHTSLDINAIKGALVTNTHGAEFYIVGISVDLESHEIMIWMREPSDEDDTKPATFGVYWNSIKDWDIHLLPHTSLPV